MQDRRPCPLPPRKQAFEIISKASAFPQTRPPSPLRIFYRFSATTISPPSPPPILLTSDDVGRFQCLSRFPAEPVFHGHRLRTKAHHPELGSIYAPTEGKGRKVPPCFKSRHVEPSCSGTLCRDNLFVGNPGKSISARLCGMDGIGLSMIPPKPSWG